MCIAAYAYLRCFVLLLQTDRFIEVNMSDFIAKLEMH